MSDMEPILSVITCMYKLVKASPGRFRQVTTNQDECTWVIHHEAWLRGQSVVYFAKNRRRD